MMSDVHLSGKAKMNPAYLQKHLPEIQTYLQKHLPEIQKAMDKDMRVKLSWSKCLALAALWILHKIKK